MTDQRPLLPVTQEMRAREVLARFSERDGHHGTAAFLRDSARVLDTESGGRTCIDAMLAFTAEQDGWQPIDTDYPPHNPVLVSRPSDVVIYTATTAFFDATGVWRVFRSEGGMEPLPFKPTHFRKLPTPPSNILDSTKEAGHE